MTDLQHDLRARCNHARFDPEDGGGLYESFFQRANHPTRPLGFWIRHTVFAPRGRPGEAVGELWAIFFDGETQEHVAVRTERPIAECAFARDAFAVTVGDLATLGPGALVGEASRLSDAIAWDLRWRGQEAPLFDLPLGLYDRGFPKAKALVGTPLATFDGVLRVNGREIEVDGWRGSENHNWGRQHTDNYAWGQVAGFDGAPDTFLELATARVRLGPPWSPLYSPWMTPLVVRHEGRELALNSLARTLRRGRYRPFDWRFEASGEGARVEGRIHGAPEDFVCLVYRNPPGGAKHCLNSKIATCELRLWLDGDRTPLTLQAPRRAAFEILTDDTDHGLEPAA